MGEKVLQRQTIQKQLILEALDRFKMVKGHLSIDEIYNAIKEVYPSISKTTVYRNVRQLAEAGTIRQITLEDGIERYDLNTHDHHHFTCTSCGEIYDVDVPELPNFSQSISKHYGFSTEKINLSFSGICAECAE